MNAAELTEAVWPELGSIQTTQDGYAAARQLDHDGATEPYCCIALASDGGMHLLIAVADDVSFAGVPCDLRFLTVSLLREYRIVGRGRQSYLSLRCGSQVYAAPFTRLVQDVVRLVLHDGQAPAEAIGKCIALWRAFWQPTPAHRMSEQAQIGLIGELLFLTAVVEAGSDGISAWQGPHADRWDFRFVSGSYEVKTCIGLPPSHVISGLDQLESDPRIPLSLVSVVLDRCADGPITLTHMVDGILDHLSEPSGTVFLSKLAAVGYSPMDRHVYTQSRYVLVQVQAFAVDAGFPRLTRTCLLKDLNPRVHSVRYTVDLAGMVGNPLDSVAAAIAAAGN